MVMAMLYQANKDNRGSLMFHMENEYTVVNDNYLTSVTYANNLLIKRKGMPS